MTSKANFYRKFSLWPIRVHSLLHLVVLRVVVFICLMNILNTTISLPVLQQADYRNAAQYSPENDPDNSLLELVMENYLDASASTSTPLDDADEPLTEIEYLLNKYNFSLKPFGINKTLYRITAHASFIHPHLESVTPPPKHV